MIEPLGEELDKKERSTDVFGRAVAFALNMLLPPRCPINEIPVVRQGALTPNEWEKICFIDDPSCARCGAPFAHDFDEGAECGSCIAEPPAFDRARAAAVYDEASHALIVAFKHADRTALAPLFAGWRARARAGMVTTSSILAPVPLHRRRLFSRRYSQSTVLAQRLAGATGARFSPMFFERLRAAPAQQGMSAEARRRNLAGAIGVRRNAASEAKGAAVVIIDDGMPAGATLSVCPRAAKRAGAVRVEALVLARTMKGDPSLG